ncbi:MAG: chemotaxis protein CheW, partial [Desulfuromonadales bacterium]|nr:chemotaxis protein CheW [Desulfuromonadales bacterium]
EVTETSGRGVGMDVVKSAVEDLGGTLNIRSAPGEGTRFQLRLPLSIAIIKLILVRCAGFALALPVTRVQRILELPRESLQSSDGRTSFLLDEERVRLVPLAAALGLEPAPLEETVCVVLAEMHGGLIGLQVDDFLGHRDAFVKNLGFPLNLLDGLSGATIEGDGSVLFIVDPQTLLGADSSEAVA